MTTNENETAAARVAYTAQSSEENTEDHITINDAQKVYRPTTSGPPIQSKEERGKSMRQVVAAFIVNLGTINTGLVFGFSAVAIPQLKQADSLIHIDDSQSSWIASLASAATAFGCIFSGILMDKIGRKKTLLLTEIPSIIGWLTILFATEVHHIYIGRLLTGLASGMVGAPARVYTSEITQPHLRGMLGALASVSISFGVLFQYTVGSIASWQVLSMCSATIPIVALLLMYMMPESPNYLVARSKPQKAVKSLSQLRGSKCNIQREIDHMQNFVQKTQATRKPSFRETLKLLISPSSLKPLIILVTYFGLYQFSGVNTITFYAVEVFKKSGTDWDSNTCTIAMGVIRLIFTIVGCVSMRHFGKRPLTFLSSIGCGLSMIGLGGYLYYRSFTTDPVATWFPVACIFIFTICCTLGYLIVPWVMIGEIYPQKVRGVLGGLTTCSAHIFVFSVVKTYPMMANSLDQHGTFILYGCVSLLSTIFYYFYLPETKGKTLQEIEDYFSGRVKSLKSNNSNFNMNINTAPKTQIAQTEKEKLLLA